MNLSIENQKKKLRIKKEKFWIRWYNFIINEINMMNHKIMIDFHMNLNDIKILHDENFEEINVIFMNDFYQIFIIFNNDLYINKSLIYNKNY